MADSFLDGAKVISQAIGRFGVDYNGDEIIKLAIARSDNDRSDAIYLFACNTENIVVGDLLYSSVEEAKSDALRFYELNEIAWSDARVSD